jgi:hypothetical protein
MNSDAWLSILFVMLALILPIASLKRRQVPWNSLLIMALIWAAIFGVLIVVVGVVAR